MTRRISKPTIYPRGTELRDVPPLSRGVTPMEYLDMCIEQWKREKPVNQMVEQVAVKVMGGRKR